jgi:hypothetical protein
MVSGLRLFDGYRRFSSRGRAASSAQAGARVHVVAWWYRLPAYARILVFGSLVIAGAVVGAIAGYSPLTSAGVSAGGILAVGAFLITPQIGITALACILTAPLLVPLGRIYTSSPENPLGDASGGAISLFVLYAVGLWVASRWSRGRVWVTASLMTTALLFFGPFLYLAFPGLGLNAARLTVGAVLVLRCGGAAWVVGVVGLTMSRLRSTSYVEEADGYVAAGPADVSAAWRRRAAVEKATAQILSDLPSKYQVLHDVMPPRGNIAIGHLVVGPCGVVLIASAHATGPVHEGARTGLTIPGVPLDDIVGDLIASKPLVAKSLKSHPRDVSMMIVIHGADACMDKRITVAVHNAAAPGKALESVVLIPGELLSEEIVSPLTIWSPLKAKQTIHRARMRMRPAVLPKEKPPAESPVRLSRVDEDGHLIDMPQGQSSFAPGVLIAGASVDIETTLGTLHGLRIIKGPVIDTKGERVVYVCTEEEYLEGTLAERMPHGHPFPVGSVRTGQST